MTDKPTPEALEAAENWYEYDHGKEWKAGDSWTKELARALDAFAQQARDAALEEAAQIIEKWDPISDRWADMPHLPSGIKRRMLQQVHALKSAKETSRE